jgi:SAM-dependent methyltransferase
MSNPLSTSPWWNSYYSGHHQSNESWDWYLPLTVVETFIQRVLSGEFNSLPSSSLSIYHPGCGSSDLSLFLARFASSLVNVDFSSSAITHMSSRLANSSDFSHVKFVLEDVRAISWAGNSFDLIVDKGTLDCTVLDDDPTSGYRYLSECYRVLKEGGIMLCFSLFPYHERIVYFDQGCKVTRRQTLNKTENEKNEEEQIEFPPLPWRLRYQAIPISPLEMPQQQATYLYIAVKIKPNEEENQQTNEE